MAHPSRGMDLEERASPRDRSLLIHEGRPALVCLGVAIRRSDGGSPRTFRFGRNCFGKPAGRWGYVGLCLQERTGRIWAPGGRYRADRPRAGGEHHTLARATTPRDSALRRGVLLDAQPGREKSKQRRTPLGAAATHDTLGEPARRVFRRDRLADYLCNWSGSRRTGPRDETECMGSSAKVFIHSRGVCHYKPPQPLWISLACPRCPISRGIVLFAAYHCVSIHRLSFVHCGVFRDAACACDRGGSLALGRGKVGSCVTAAELVTLGIVLGTKYSDLRSCLSARHRSGHA